MKTAPKIKIISVVLGVGTLLLSSSPLFAQQATLQTEPSSGKIEVAAIPPRVGDDGELTGNPGEVLQTSIKVRNVSDKTITYQSIATDFVIGDDGETPIPVTEQVTQRWSLASWVTLSPGFQELAPNQIGQIQVLITIPKDALPGGHYAMITHQPILGNQAELAQQSAAIINQRVGTLLYVIVNGPINEEAFIRDFTIPKFTEFGPVPFAFMVDNQSDIHIKPRISVEIKNFFGRTEEIIQLEEKNIFPLSSRNYQGVWDRIWGIGPYKASVTMSYGAAGQVVTNHETFWLFPITLLWVAIIVMLVTIVITILVRRHWAHRTNQDKARVKMLEDRLAQLEQEKQQQVNR